MSRKEYSRIYYLKNKDKYKPKVISDNSNKNKKYNTSYKSKYRDTEPSRPTHCQGLAQYGKKYRQTNMMKLNKYVNKNLCGHLLMGKNQHNDTEKKAIQIYRSLVTKQYTIKHHCLEELLKKSLKR